MAVRHGQLQPLLTGDIWQVSEQADTVGKVPKLAFSHEAALRVRTAKLCHHHLTYSGP